MAIKDYNVVDETLLYTCDVAGEAGTLMVQKSSQPTGRAVGDGFNEAAPVAVPGSGTPASGTVVVGVLMGDVVDIDQTRQHRNYQRVEQVVGENVWIMKDGFVRTDKVVGTPAAGADAYIGADGKFSATQTNSIPKVGRFETAKGSDGFARVAVKLA